MDIKVISHLPEALYGRFDGVDYAFLPEKATVLSLAAATHIFDLGEEDKSRALNRLGLLIPGRSTYQEALDKLDQISFMKGKTVFDDDDDTPTDGMPAEAPRGAPRTGGRRPHVGPSGDSGEASASPAGSR